MVSCTVRRVPVGNPKTWSRDCGNECQNENIGRTTHRLPETYWSAERVLECKGRTLHNVTSGRKCYTINFSFGLFSKCILSCYSVEWKGRNKPKLFKYIYKVNRTFRTTYSITFYIISRVSHIYQLYNFRYFILHFLIVKMLIIKIFKCLFVM